MNLPSNIPHVFLIWCARSRKIAIAHLSHPSLFLHDSLLPMQILIQLSYVERENFTEQVCLSLQHSRKNITLESLDRPKTSLKTLEVITDMKTLEVITDKGIPITKHEHLLTNRFDALKFKRKTLTITFLYATNIVYVR